MTHEKPRHACTATVYPNGWIRGYQCTNAAKYGDHCGIHSPEKQAERREARGPTRFERELASIKAQGAKRRELEESNSRRLDILRNIVSVWGPPANMTRRQTERFLKRMAEAVQLAREELDR